LATAKKRIKRRIGFTPTYTSFLPAEKSQETCDAINLTDDELEALRLIDFLGLYQEEAAKKMNVSRPTFSRIVDRARKKVVDFILHGKHLKIDQSEERSYRIALPTDDGEQIATHHILCNYFAIMDVVDGVIETKTLIENPVQVYIKEHNIDMKNHPDGQGLGAGRLIPPLLKEVNLFIAYKLGDGMRRNLEGMGVRTILTKTKDIVKIASNLN